MSKKSNLYIGRAGQLVVMAEFLMRGWNVAIPEVDIGDDLFIIKDEDGALSRIQVKTASAEERQDGYSARHALRFTQLSQPSTPDITYIFVSRLRNHWKPFLIVPRSVLYEEHDLYQVGSLTQNGLVTLYIRFSTNNGKVICSERDFSSYLDNWKFWPLIQH
jgi:hypothetical protein